MEGEELPNPGDDSGMSTGRFEAPNSSHGTGGGGGPPAPGTAPGGGP